MNSFDFSDVISSPIPINPKGWIKMPLLGISGEHDEWKLVDFMNRFPDSIALRRRDGTDLFAMHPEISHHCDLGRLLAFGILEISEEAQAEFPAWNRARVYVKADKIEALREIMRNPCEHYQITAQRENPTAADMFGSTDKWAGWGKLPKGAIKPNKGGAPEKYDWEWYFSKFKDFVAVNGLPGPLKEYQDTDGKFHPWSRQAHAEKWLKSLGLTTGDDIGDSSARSKIKQWLGTLKK